MPAPVYRPNKWPADKSYLMVLGVKHAIRFCELNGLEMPLVTSHRSDKWPFHVCAYYRPDLGVNICLEHCGRLAPEANCRNWSWPGNVTDREPFGVICHELAHHCDWHRGTKKGRYFSDYGESIRDRSGEKQLTGYCDNDAEWFAEMMRLYISNPDLLRLVRPKTWALLHNDWKPATTKPWTAVLGNAPQRVVNACINKFAS